MTIRVALCVGQVERDAAIIVYKKAGLTVTWYGSDPIARCEKFQANNLVRCCPESEQGPDAFVVVGAPAGTGPNLAP